jgi:hypothetical protein
MLKIKHPALNKALSFLIVLAVFCTVPSYAVSAAESKPADTYAAAMPAEGEEEFFEGAQMLEGTSFELPDDTPAEAPVYTAKKLKKARSGGSGYSLYDLGGNEYGYNSLSDNQKLLFDAIGERLEAFIDSADYRTDLTEETARLETRVEYLTQNDLTDDELAETLCRFVYSNPQYYWIGINYAFASNDSCVSAVTYVDPYYYSYASRKAVDDAVNAKLDKWVDEVTEAASLGDFYGALKAHDIIIRAIDYSYNASGQPEQSVWAHSVAGVFTGQGAVCEGYAKCFEYLLNKAGIPNIYILGTGAKEAHAWNAVELSGQWYLCDITWDDPNLSADAGLKDSNYSYFCIPASKFNKNHKAWGSKNYYGYELPEFEDTMEQSYFTVFDAYSDEAFTEASGESFAMALTANRYHDSDFVFAAFPTDAKSSFDSYVAPHLDDLDPEAGYIMTDTAIGCVVKYASPMIESPAGSISIKQEAYEVGISESITVEAQLPAGSDDRVVWSVRPADAAGTADAERYVQVRAKGTEAVVTGRRNGAVILTAAVYSSLKSDEPITAECTVRVGTGADAAEATIWQNGIKSTKSATLKTELSASMWKDSKGKIKKGKLVWFVCDTPIEPSFNQSKHTVSFGAAKSKLAAVNAKGVITAKKAGTVYVYACDTGSMTYEEHVVDIAAGPTKLFLTSVPNSTNKDVVLKKTAADAGSSYRVYITPFIKDGAVDADCTYTVRVAKPEQEKYLSVEKAVIDEAGNPYFIVNALDFDQIKAKTVSVKVEVICDQTGKKASLTVVIGNPTLDATCKAPDEETTPEAAGAAGTPTSAEESLWLSKKGSSVTLKLYLSTALGDTNITTDKIKIYVGLSDVSFNENDRVEAERGATVKAKFDKNTMQLTLTASKDAGKTALVTAAFTDVLTKEITLIDLVEVDENGELKVW